MEGIVDLPDVWHYAVRTRPSHDNCRITNPVRCLCRDITTDLEGQSPWQAQSYVNVQDIQVIVLWVHSLDVQCSKKIIRHISVSGNLVITFHLQSASSMIYSLLSTLFYCSSPHPCRFLNTNP